MGERGKRKNLPLSRSPFPPLLKILSPFLTLALSLLLAACTPATQDEAAPAAPRIGTAQELVAAMRTERALGPDHTLTFVQESIVHHQDGRIDTTIWYEAATMGKLRIDFAPIADGNGVLYADGRRYLFQDGVLVNERPEVNPLQLLLMDVFMQPAEATLHGLDTLGFDLSKMHEATFAGRPVYVVGADAGDEASKQFWVDQEHLHTVRVIDQVGPDGSAVLDAQVTGFEDVGGFMHENEILIYVNGTLVQEEQYNNIRVGEDLDPSLFDPARWRVETPYWE